MLWELVPWQDQLLGKKSTIPFNFIPFQWVFADHNCVLYAVLHSCFHPEIPVTTKQTLINREKGSFLVKVLVQHMFMECLLCIRHGKQCYFPACHPSSGWPRVGMDRISKHRLSKEQSRQWVQGLTSDFFWVPCSLRLSHPIPPPQCCPLHLTLPLGLHFPS